MPTQIQGIEFEVVGNASNAAESLDKLAVSLSKVKRVTSGGLGLSGLGKDMKALSNAMKGFNAGKLESFGKAMTGMASAVRALAKGSEGMRLTQLVLEGIAKIDFTNLQKAGEAAKNIAAVTRLIAGISEGGKQAAMSSQKMALFNAALGKVGNGALKAGKSLLSMPFKNVADRVKSLNGRLSNLLSSLKRIAFYRIIRTIIKEIGQAFKDGMNNLYGWSALVNGKFKSSMDMMATSMLYFKNSIGAAVAPIINALAPALDFLIDKVVALINVINQLFARLTGAKFWTRAKKKADEYGDAVGGAGQAAKDAIHYLAPFDELNVLPDNKDHGGGGGGGEDFSDMFEEVTEFSDEIKNFADAIKQAIRDGDWQGLGTLLGEKINELIDRIDFAGLGAKVGEKINAWFTTKYWTLETINFHTIGQNIATFLNNMLYEIDFDTLGRTITQPFTNLGDLIIGALGTVDWSRVGSSIKDFVIGAFNQMSEFFDRYNWTEIGTKLFEGLNEFISGLKPLEVLSSIGEFILKLATAIFETTKGFLTEVWKGLLEWLKGLVSGLSEFFSNIHQTIQDFLFNDRTFIDDSGVAWTFDVEGNLVKVEDNVPKKDKILKGLQGAVEKLEDKLTDTDKTFELDGVIKSARDATHGTTVLNAVAEIIEAYDNTLRDPLVGAVAALQRWEKANGFDSTISDMAAEFIKWGVTSGFGRQISDMVAVFTKWKKDNPQVFDEITDLVAKFKKWKKDNGFPDTIDGIIAGFTSWVKNNPTVFSQISGMIANLASWAKENGFSNTITGFTAALTSYLKQFDDPTFNAVANIIEAIDFTDGDFSLQAVANVIKANPTLAQDPVLQAIAYIIDADIPGDMVAYIPGEVIPGLESPFVDPGSPVHDDPHGRSGHQDRLANGGFFTGGFWHDIPQFASGGLLRGSMFIAGEAGPELVGHIGGRTEVLNRSQIAATMYASMNSALRSSEPNEGVSEDAMYRAFRRALDETDFGGDIELDGDTLYSAMVTRNNRNTRMTGVNAFA